MKKFKNLECADCGSSHYKQIADDLFECEYCGAKIINDNSVRDSFVSDIKDVNNINKKIYFIKTNIKEDVFYKKALTHLSMNKNSPTDILESKFEFVKARYVFYISLDVDFEVLSVSNVFSQNYSGTKINISTKESTIFSEGKYICNPITNDTLFDQTKYVLQNISNLSSDIYSVQMTNNEIKERNIILPTKEEVNRKIDEAINEHKSKMLAFSKNRGTNVIHKINSIKIYAIPEYSIEYEYKGQKYKLTSFANNLNIIGDVPNDEKSVKKAENKRYLPIFTLSLLLFISNILFGIYNIINRSYSALKYNLILILATIIFFVLGELIYRILIKNYKIKLFKTKKSNLEKHLSSINLKFDEGDTLFIESFKRWY